MDGRIESHIVDHEMPPLEDGSVTAESTERPSLRPRDNLWEVKRRWRADRDRSRSPPNIFASNNGDNRNSREVNNAPRRRGLLGLNNVLRRMGLLGLNNAS